MDDAAERTLRGRLLKTSELVAQEILFDIVERELDSGERLPQESEMIRSYGVGRSTIREALRILEVAGLVQMRSGPQGGPRVRAAVPADFGRMASLFLQAQQITLGEVLSARQLLETAFTREATIRQDREFLERVAELYRQGEALDIRDDNAYLEVTGAFHVLLADASSNRVLSAVAQALISMFVGDLDSDIFPARDRRRLLVEHQEVLEAILARDAERAASLMAAHMEHLVQGIERRQPAAFQSVIRWR